PVREAIGPLLPDALVERRAGTGYGHVQVAVEATGRLCEALIVLAAAARDHLALLASTFMAVEARQPVFACFPGGIGRLVSAEALASAGPSRTLAPALRPGTSGGTDVSMGRMPLRSPIASHTRSPDCASRNSRPDSRGHDPVAAEHLRRGDLPAA